jgi:hypothetical protein
MGGGGLHRCVIAAAAPQVPVARGQVYGPGVYLSEDPEFAMSYVHGQQRLLFASCLLRANDRRVAKGTQGSTYNIVVAAQKERVLPKYVVYFQPRHMGANRPSVGFPAPLYNPFHAGGAAVAANPFGVLGVAPPASAMGGFNLAGPAPAIIAGGFQLGNGAPSGAAKFVFGPPGPVQPLVFPGAKAAVPSAHAAGGLPQGAP